MRCKACNSLIFWTTNRQNADRLIDPDLCNPCNFFTEFAIFSDTKEYVHGYTTQNNITVTDTSFSDEE